jgi:hypothetical protein
MLVEDVAQEPELIVEADHTIAEMARGGRQ